MTSTISTPIDGLLWLRSQESMDRRLGNPPDLATLLIELHAPPTLPGFFRIACNTCTLLREAKATAPPEQRVMLQNSIRELRWMIANVRKLAEALFTNGKDRERFLRVTGSNPVIGAGALQHGLWCLLWERHPRRSLQQAFRAVQTEVLLAHREVLRYWADRAEWRDRSAIAENIEESLYLRTRALRHFVMSRYLVTNEHNAALERISSLSSQNLSIKETLLQVRGELRWMEGTRDPRQVTRDVSVLLGLLLWSRHPERIRAIRQDDEDLSALTETANLSEEYPKSDSINLQDSICIGPIHEEEDVSPEGSSSASIFKMRREKRAEISALVESGIHPEEVFPIEVMTLADRRSGNACAWLQMENQFLPVAWTVPATQELAEGFDLLIQAATSGGIRECELLLLTLIVFARGVTAEQAEALVCRTDRPQQVNELTLILGTDGDEAEWLIPTVPLPYLTPSSESHPGCRPCSACYAMPDYWRIGRRILPLIRQTDPHWDGSPVRPLARDRHSRPDRDDLPARLKNTIIAQDRDRAEYLTRRFTFQRIRKAFFQRCLTETDGDPVPATYLTMQTHPSCEVTRFYDTPSICRLQAIERAVWQHYAEEFSALDIDLAVDLSIPAKADPGFLGSSFCPLQDALQAVIKETRQIVSHANERGMGKSAMHNFILRHNAYTLYTYIGVTLGTCHRPTHNGIPSLKEIDADTGMVAIADKGANKARLVPIADAALLQLRAYREYMDFFDSLQWTPELLPFEFFFLEQDRTPVQVSPGSLKDRLPFAPNFARHYLRTTLAERWHRGEKSLSPEQVSVLLGHAAEGQLPYGWSSSFNYYAFRKCTIEVLGLVLEEVNFFPISVKGSRRFTGEIALERLR